MSEIKHKSRAVTDDESGIRLDRWFKRHFPALSHGQLQKLLRTGQVRVGGKRAETSTRLEAGQEIRVPPLAAAAPKIREEHQKKHSESTTRKLKDMILFQDDDVIAINKPPGLATQGGTGLRENLDDMMEALATKAHGKPKLVHRLDRDTSGVLLFARNAYAATKLAASFRHRDTQKIYWALTVGVPSPERGELFAPLVKRGETVVVDEEKSEDAKPALTRYEVLEKAKNLVAFVALWPITGRTHQLRVHMQYIGTPILGDRLYGNDTPSALPYDELGKGLHLHARKLIIPHPRRGIITVAAPLSSEMRKTWKWFSFDANALTDSEMD